MATSLISFVNVRSISSTGNLSQMAGSSVFPKNTSFLCGDTKKLFSAHFNSTRKPFTTRKFKYPSASNSSDHITKKFRKENLKDESKIHYTITAEIEVDCSADKFYHIFKYDVKELPNCMSHIYQNVEVLEGDGIGAGSVKLWHYMLEEGGRCLTAKKKMIIVDDEKRLMTHCVIEGEVLNDYKCFYVTLVVTPKDQSGDVGSCGSVVKWSVEYEKGHKDCLAPMAYIDVLERVTEDLNTYLHNQAHPQ